MKHIKGEHMAIKMIINDDGDFEFYTITEVQIPATIPMDAGSEKAQKFLDKLNEYEYDVTLMADEWRERVLWNQDHPEKRKQWPVFDKLDSFIERRMLEAGIEMN